MAKNNFHPPTIILLTFLASFIAKGIQQTKELYAMVGTVEKLLVVASVGFIVYWVCLYKYNKKKAVRIKNIKPHVDLVPFSDVSVIRDIQGMDPIETEHYIAKLMKKLGYKKVTVTPAGSDGGKDITALDHDGKLVFVEVKRYASDNSIGRPLIQKLHSACVDGYAERGIFVTTSYFTQAAIEYAERNNIELVDARVLNQWISQTKKDNSFNLVT